MVETYRVTLRRQWTDKLKDECLFAALPPTVHVRHTKSPEEEFVLESSNLDDLCEAVSKIKRLVIDQLVGPHSGIRSQSNGITMNEEMDEDKKKDVRGKKASDLEDEEHDDTRPGTADGDSRKTVNDRNKTSREETKKKGLQTEQHSGPPRDEARQQRQGTNDDSKRAGDDSHEDDLSGNNVAASAAKSGQKSVGDARDTAAGDRGKSTSDSEETRQKATKPGQHSSPPDNEAKRQKQNTCEGDGDDSEKNAVSAKDSSVQDGVRATAKDSEPRENHHTAHVSERSDQDNAGETNASPDDDVSAASDDRHDMKYQIDEPLWAYIRFINPHKWDKKLSASQHTKQGSDTVELTGSSTDIDEFKTFCDTNRLARAVVRKLQRLPDKCTAEEFRRRLLGLSDPKILLRSTVDDPHFCELVGKRSDVDKLEKAISLRYPELVETKHIPNIPQATTSTGQTSATNAASATSSSAAASTCSYAAALASGNNFSNRFDQTRSGMREQTSEPELDFQTALAQIRVQIVTGDLLKWRCEVLVDSCDSELTHLGGISSLFAKAAGRKMQAECDAFKRQHGCLPICGVLDTTAGNIEPPVRRLIHACSPNGRLWHEIGPMLEQTFLNCLMYANDKLHARSIALPAISSGAPSLTRVLVFC